MCQEGADPEDEAAGCDPWRAWCREEAHPGVWVVFWNRAVEHREDEAVF